MKYISSRAIKKTPGYITDWQSNGASTRETRKISTTGRRSFSDIFSLGSLHQKKNYTTHHLSYCSLSRLICEGSSISYMWYEQWAYQYLDHRVYIFFFIQRAQIFNFTKQFVLAKPNFQVFRQKIIFCISKTNVKLNLAN